MKIPLRRWIRHASHVLRDFGPYVALLLLPGGSLIVLAAWVYRHRTMAAVRP